MGVLVKHILQNGSVTYPNKAFIDVSGVGKRGVACWITARYMKIGEGGVLINPNKTGKVKRHRCKGLVHLVGDVGFGVGVGGVGGAGDSTMLFCHLASKSYRVLGIAGFYHYHNRTKQLLLVNIGLGGIDG